MRGSFGVVGQDGSCTSQDIGGVSLRSRSTEHHVVSGAGESSWRYLLTPLRTSLPAAPGRQAPTTGVGRGLGIDEVPTGTEALAPRPMLYPCVLTAIRSWPLR